MNKNIFILLYFLFVTTRAYTEIPNDYDEVLCGKKPIDADAELIEEKAAHAQLEDLMPPVANQTPAAWCYAFATADALNYYNFINSTIKSPRDFYHADKMISPIELVYQGNKFIHDHQKVLQSSPVGIDTTEAGTSLSIYLGLNDNGWKVRSLNLMPFESLDDKNPKAIANVQNLIATYEAKNGKYRGDTTINVIGVSCPEPVYFDPHFKNLTEGFNQINQWLYKNALSTSNLSSDYAIKNYKEVADPKGEADINTTPFKTNKYEGTDTNSYLKLLSTQIPGKNILNAHPVSISLCSEDLESDKISSPAKCRNHTVNIVGAYYKNGKCSVRIRNTWGADWGDHGHVDLTVDELLASQEKYARDNSTDSKYTALWITPKTESSKALKINMLKDNGDRTEGVYKITYNGSYSFHYKTEQFNQYTKNKMTEAQNYPLPDNKTFTGKVIDLGDGKIQIDSGLISKNGKLVEAVKYNFSGKIYSGPIKDDGGGKFHTIGVIK